MSLFPPDLTIVSSMECKLDLDHSNTFLYVSVLGPMLLDPTKFETSRAVASDLSQLASTRVQQKVTWQLTLHRQALSWQGH